MQLLNILSLALLGTSVASAYNLKLRGEGKTVELKSRRTHECQPLDPIAAETVLFDSQESREMITIYSGADCEKKTRIHRQCFSNFQQKFESPGEVARSYKVIWGFGCGSNDKA